MNIVLFTIDALRKDSADSMDFVKELKKVGTSLSIGTTNLKSV